MSRSLTSRAATQAYALSRASRCSAQTVRSFSQTVSRCDDSKPPTPSRSASQSVLNDLYGAPQTTRSTNPMAGISNNPIFKGMGSHTRVDTSSLMAGAPRSEPSEPPVKQDPEPYHLHIFSSKHNTHVTCTKPNREPIISLSCGNLGYRKARRGLYDSAYSLTKYVIDRLVHTGWPPKIDRLELTLRGFGQGRDAGVKVLMSPEGKILRDKIVRVSDSTRIKFGGTRSKRPRRL
ncbi:ribosomal protein s11 domain-containing protein [Sarocladium implicatum]|nr:ribosomal protein s11 domain-containing protein [Sarocladium implicatum]